jgi:ABC-2 type transport system permease protein
MLISTEHKKHLISLYTIVRRELLRIIRIWPQTILPPIITTALYFLIFGSLIGSQVAAINSHSYIQYITPGLIMLAVINNSYTNVVTSFFGSKFQRHIEELLISPTPNFLILTGYILGGVTRGVLVGLLVTIISLFFTNLHIMHFGLMCYVIFMTCILFSLGGFINGIYARNFDDTSIIPTFFLTPLTYLGGVFFSSSMLPSFGQTLALINPIYYIINAFRYAFLGIEEVNIYFAVSILTLTAISLYFFAWYLLHKGIGIRH